MLTAASMCYCETVSDLRDQLLKAGLVSADQARDAEREEKRNRRQRGARGQKRRQKERDQAFADKQNQQATKHRQEALANRSSEERREAELRAQQLVAAHAWSGNTHGKRRWYFADRNGCVPFFELNEVIAQKLERGQAALAQDSNGKVTVISAECAERLDGAAPHWLVFWAKRRA